MCVCPFGEKRVSHMSQNSFVFATCIPDLLILYTRLATCLLTELLLGMQFACMLLQAYTKMQSKG